MSDEDSLLSPQKMDQLRRFMEIRDRRDQLRVELKTAEEEYRDAEADLYEVLRTIKGKVKVDLGEPWGWTGFGGSETVYATVHNEAEALEYYSKLASTAAVAGPKLKMGILNSEVRTALETPGTPLPPGVGWTKKRVVSVTRQK